MRSLLWNESSKFENSPPNGKKIFVGKDIQPPIV